MSNQKSFDYIVIGGGSGGIASANRAAMHGASVLLIEAGKLGGTCVNRGCVPKKVMWNASHLAQLAKHHAGDYGLDLDLSGLSWSELVERREAYIQRLNGVYLHNLNRNGVTVKQGRARLDGPGAVLVDDERFEAPHILIATGGRPKIPEVPGAEHGISSDGFFQLTALPKTAAIVGSGYIGVELAGVLHGLGTKVSLFSKDDDILRHFDPMLSLGLQEEMENDGVHIERHMLVDSVRKLSDDQVCLVDAQGIEYGPFEKLIWAIGREPQTAALNLESIGIETTADGYIPVDEFENTSATGVYALGDVAPRLQLTPTAIAAGRKLARRLFNKEHDLKQDYDHVPTVVFSHPPIGTVGLTEPQAYERYDRDDIQIFKSDFVNMFYALGDRKVRSRVKMICLGKEQRVIGLHVFGDGADEMIQGFAVAIKMGATKADFDATVAVHPTAAEELVLLK